MLTQHDRLETVLERLPEPEAAEIRWLLKGTSFSERPWPWERLDYLSKVLPESEMAELKELFVQWTTDDEKEKGVFKFITDRYPTNIQNEMFFLVYAAYNCMEMKTFKNNWETAMGSAG